MDKFTNDAPNPCTQRPPTLPPALPIELAELILLCIPLQFSLSSLTGEDESIHDTCAAAFTALAPHPIAYKIFVPRFFDGAAKLCADRRFDVAFIHRLHQRGFNLQDRSTFKAALEHNRVDVLDWWANTAKLEAPAGPNDDCTDSLTRHAMKCKAWDALNWLGRTSFLAAVDIGLMDMDMCELISSGGEEELQIVETWILSDIDMSDSDGCVLDGACYAGNMRLLEALRKHRSECVYECDDEFQDVCAKGAVQEGHTHVLEWLVRVARWKLSNVAEWACEDAKLDVLQWYKANKDWVEPDRLAWIDKLKVGDEGEPSLPDDGKVGFCLDLASRTGHVDVLQWLARNPDSISPLYTRLAMDSASAKGHLGVLEWWKAYTTCTGVTLFCSANALHSATRGGHLHVLDWWVKKSGLPLRYDTTELFRNAILATDLVNVLNWWLCDSGLEFDLTQCSDILSKCDSDSMSIVHHWFYKLGCPSLFPCNVPEALCNAAREGDVMILDWWKHSGIPLGGFDHQLMDAASSGAGRSKASRLPVIEWVCRLHAEHGIDLQYSIAALDDLEWGIVDYGWDMVLKPRSNPHSSKWSNGGFNQGIH